MTPEQRELSRIREVEAAELNKCCLPDAVYKINEEFIKDNIPHISENDIRFRLQIVGDWGLEGSKLSENLFNTFFPKANLDFYSHYRSLEGFEKIVKGKKLRFYSLVKHFGQEFQQFYVDHNMDGYFNKIYLPSGKPYIEYLMSEIFTLCLSGDKDKETINYCWSSFGNQGKGVKLIFEINSRTTDFRKILYRKKKTGAINSIKNLNTFFIKNFNRFFLFSQTSKFGAFYINNSMTLEDEYRFLIKKQTDNYGFASEIQIDNDLTAQYGKEISYIEENFINPYGEFKLKKVQPGPYCDIKEVRRILNEGGFNDVEVLEQYLESEFESK